MLSFDPTKLPNESWFRIAMFFCALVVSPSWFIYQFADDIFFKLDLPRLVIFCMAIGIPILLINSFIISGLEHIAKNNSETINLTISDFVGGAIFTIIVLYTPSVAAFARASGKMSINMAIVTAAAMQIVFSCFLIIPAFIYFCNGVVDRFKNTNKKN